MPYTVLSHTADTGIVAYGGTLYELFENAAYGMFDLMYDLEALGGGPDRPVMAAGDTVELLEHPYEQWRVERVFGLLVGDDRDPEAIEQLSGLDVLAESWRKRARRLHSNLQR